MYFVFGLQSLQARLWSALETSACVPQSRAQGRTSGVYSCTDWVPNASPALFTRMDT